MDVLGQEAFDLTGGGFNSFAIVSDQVAQPAGMGVFGIVLADAQEVAFAISHDFLDEVVVVGFVSDDPGVLREVKVELVKGGGVAFNRSSHKQYTSTM